MAKKPLERRVRACPLVGHSFYPPHCSLDPSEGGQLLDKEGRAQDGIFIEITGIQQDFHEFPLREFPPSSVAMFSFCSSATLPRLLGMIHSLQKP